MILSLYLSAAICAFILAAFKRPWFAFSLIPAFWVALCPESLDLCRWLLPCIGFLFAMAVVEAIYWERWYLSVILPASIAVGCFFFFAGWQVSRPDGILALAVPLKRSLTFWAIGASLTAVGVVWRAGKRPSGHLLTLAALALVRGYGDAYDLFVGSKWWPELGYSSILGFNRFVIAILLLVWCGAQVHHTKRGRDSSHAV